MYHRALQRKRFCIQLKFATRQNDLVLVLARLSGRRSHDSGMQRGLFEATSRIRQSGRQSIGDDPHTRHHSDALITIFGRSSAQRSRLSVIVLRQHHRRVLGGHERKGQASGKSY